ncbi:HCP-like protein [Marasmius fiardii PR-910]|nr:HCP-like protein [Marasmius fiardii PR-910]
MSIRSYQSQPPHFDPRYAYPPPPHPHPATADPYYAAASNVLGIGPPPNHDNGYEPSIYTDYSSNSYPSSEYHSNYQHQQPPVHYHPQQQPPPGPPPPLNVSQSSLPSSISSPDTDFDMRQDARPGLGSRMDSLHPSTKKTKAVDLSTPPYTKEYIDSYRQRIKADPDPEAHFLYAKYLVDAARKIRQTAKDQKAGKRYSEILITEALKVIRRLATSSTQPFPDAQFYLANCHGSGALGLQVDHERAYHLYLQAAKQNHPAAAYRVGVCNEIGAGTRRDWSRASAFYRKSASLGDTAAMYKLGVVLMTGGLGEEKREREAVGWLKRAAEQADEENPHALHELGLLYEGGPGVSPSMREYCPPDPYAAKHLFTQAAHLGYTPSQYKLGQCYEYGTVGCAVDPRRSIAWYTKAAEKGDAEAELALSGWYLTGSEGVLKQSDSEAYLWARRAANKGLCKAEYAVGYYAEVGIGVKQDIEFAKRWYMRAAAQGNKRAMNRLTEIKKGGGRPTGVAGGRGGGPGGGEGRITRQQAKDECVIC